MKHLIALVSGLAIYAKEAGEEDGGNAYEGANEFEKSVLAGIKQNRAEQAKMTQETDRLHQKTKDALEEFDKATKRLDGLESSVKEWEVKKRRFELELYQERRHSFGSPKERILRCPKRRAVLNALIRVAACRVNPDLGAPSEEHLKIANEFAEYERYRSGMQTRAPGDTPALQYIDDDLYTDIYDLLSEYGISTDFDVVPVSTRTNKFLVTETLPVATYVDEGNQITEAQYSGTSPIAEVKSVKVLLSIPNEQLQDAEMDLAGYILELFAKAVAKREDTSCMQGAGGAPDGGMTGIFVGGTTVVAPSGATTVDGDTTGLVYTDLIATMLALPEDVGSGQDAWWMHRHTLYRLTYMTDERGRPILQTALEAPNPNAITSIMGAGVRLSAAAPSNNATGETVCVYGDPMGMVFARRMGFEFATSSDAYFDSYKTGFRGVSRSANKIKTADSFGVLTLA